MCLGSKRHIDKQGLGVTAPLRFLQLHAYVVSAPMNFVADELRLQELNMFYV